MKQTLVQARVRPARMAVLINKEGLVDDLMLAVRFLSRVWGGIYAPIIPANPSSLDETVLNELKSHRPEYVYSIGLDSHTYDSAIRAACQPRGHRLLDAEFLNHLQQNHNEQHITAAHVLQGLSHEVRSRERIRRTRHLLLDPDYPLFPFAATAFGLPYERIVAGPPHAITRLQASSTLHSLIEAQIEVAKNFELTWLDLISHRLNIAGSVGSFPPTIVLVDRLIDDLCFFWSRRIEGDLFLSCFRRKWRNATTEL